MILTRVSRINALLVASTLLATGMLFTSAAQGSLITNGDFEDTSGTFPTGWDITGGVASQESGTAQNLVIGGSESLRVSGNNGNVRQTVGTSLSDFEYSFDWLRPFSSISNARIMNAHVRQGTATPFINMRVAGAGDGGVGGELQLFSGGWQDLDPSGAATELILATETSYTFTITGSEFGTASASYDLTVVGGTVNETFTGLTFFQNAPTTAGELVDTIRFERGGTHGSATYDNVSLTGVVPEPVSLALAFLGMVSLLPMRRR